MTIVFTFFSFTIWRILGDSEPPNNIFYFAYIFLIAVDVIFVLSEYAFNQYVVKYSGAFSEDDEEKAKKKKKKEKKTERTVPFLDIVKKVTFWYTSEWPICSGYALMIVSTSGNTN